MLREWVILRRTYRYRLYPTARQCVALTAQLAFACELYNTALHQRRDAWRSRRRLIGLYQQFRELTDLRAAGLGPAGMSCAAMRDPLRRLDRAFVALFRRLKSGQRPGFPRFRSTRRYDSLTWSQWVLRQSRLALPGIGHVKVRWHRPLPPDAKIRTVTIRRHGRHWYVGFALDMPAKTPLPASGQAAGLDLGITTFAALSNGERFVGPRALRANLTRLRRAQRRLSRRLLGSQRRRKAALTLRHRHDHVRNLRRDHAFKLASDLVRRFDVIYVEDLNIKGLVRSRAARDIQDQGWGSFVRILTDKAAEAGRAVIELDPRNTSQMCSACGALVPKQLGERWHRCGCGYEADRDTNAARNLYRLGESRQASTWPTGACVV